jgi:hypothetical protein
MDCMNPSRWRQCGFWQPIVQVERGPGRYHKNYNFYGCSGGHPLALIHGEQRAWTPEGETLTLHINPPHGIPETRAINGIWHDEHYPYLGWGNYAVGQAL